MKSCRIPLTRAAVCKAITLAARQLGVPVQRIAEDVKFPLHSTKQPETLVPQLPARRFIETIAQREGDRLFGFRMAQSLSFQRIATVTPLLKDCKNLFHLLKQFCNTVHLQSDLCNYILKEEGNLIWMAQIHPPVSCDTGQVELFELSGMIHLIRLVAGTNWSPSQIHFRSARSAHLENIPGLNSLQIHFSKPWVAIAFPRHLLGQPIPRMEKICGNKEYCVLPAFPESIKERLLVGISPYLGSEKLNKTLASEITEMSFRSLQRQLAQEKTSYAKIVDQIRFEKATTLLKENNGGMLDICMQLGYENAPSFTRAFRRWSGMSPSEYRKN